MNEIVGAVAHVEEADNDENLGSMDEAADSYSMENDWQSFVTEEEVENVADEDEGYDDWQALLAEEFEMVGQKKDGEADAPKTASEEEFRKHDAAAHQASQFCALSPLF